MINLEDCQLLGNITKPHGVHGKLNLRLNNLSPDDILKMEWVFLLIDGLPVPFLVSDFQAKNNDVLIVEFKDIDTEEAALELNDLPVYISNLNISEATASTSNFSNLLGFKVYDIEHGHLGVLDDILDFEFNPILRILNDAGEILLPLQPDFIVNVDSNSKTIQVRTPDGLVDLIQ